MTEYKVAYPNAFIYKTIKVKVAFTQWWAGIFENVFG
jgi:hypothetical protein